MSRAGQSPIAFAVSVARLPARGMDVRIEADEAQRAALATEHGLEAVDSLSAELVVAPWRREGAKVTGRLTAGIVQACVVTLEPITAVIDTEVEGLFVPAGSKLARPRRLDEGEWVIDVEGPDAPEPFEGDTIDVGQFVEEHFALAIDPYPRKPGAVTEPPAPDEDEPRGPLHDALKGLSDKP